MAIDQETLNKLWVLTTKLSEKIAAEVLDVSSKLEEEHGPGSIQFKDAQKLKVKHNEMIAYAKESRDKFPHLFKGEEK